jgi:hypothetical protein
MRIADCGLRIAECGNRREEFLNFCGVIARSSSQRLVTSSPTLGGIDVR